MFCTDHLKVSIDNCNEKDSFFWFFFLRFYLKQTCVSNVVNEMVSTTVLCSNLRAERRLWGL